MKISILLVLLSLMSVSAQNFTTQMISQINPVSLQRRINYKTILKPKKFFDEKKENTLLDEIVSARISYNFFVGKDANNFASEFQGFGSISGLCLVDNLVLGYPVTFSKDGNKKLARILDGKEIGIMPFILIRTGFLSKKWRFQDDLIAKDGINAKSPIWSQDTSSHIYGSGFFSGQKSKLVATYYRFSPEFSLAFSAGNVPFNVSFGPLIDVLLGIKQKNKFELNGKSEKVVRRENKNFGASQFVFGASASISTKIFGIYGSYCFTPMFSYTNAPVLNPVEIGLFLHL